MKYLDRQMMNSIHKPVLLQETLNNINPKAGEIFVDCTLGGGGHLKAILEKSKGDEIIIIAFDIDEEAIERFSRYLIKEGWINEKINNIFEIIKLSKGKQIIFLVRSNFVNLKKVLEELKIEGVRGIIADLGVSSDQLGKVDRGFSYIEDGPLDMRMSKSMKVTAEDLVNGLYKDELESVFKNYGDERYAKTIAKAIVSERKKRKIQTTLHLVNIINKVLPFKNKGKAIRFKRVSSRSGIRVKHPAIRVFQALRIAVNNELDSLRLLLPQMLEALCAGGVGEIISFHSGEDRIVKQFLKNKLSEGLIDIVNKKPVVPGDDEFTKNKRARSAKLRIFKKL